MGKSLIIAEKPSLAKNIVSSIKDDQFQTKDGYFEGQKYIVTFVFGHLFEAYDIEDYTKNEGDWNLDILPFCPENNKFSFKLKTKKEKDGKKITDPGVQKQFKIIYQLVNSPNVDLLINCGDSDREGEAIIRLIIRNTDKIGKPCKRLWLPEQTPIQIRYGLTHLEDASVHDNLANEGFSRLYMDWLYGINLTRYITLKSQAPKGHPLRVGRVLSAIVNAIYEREMEIRNFVPTKYFICVSEEETNGEVVFLKSEKKFDEADFIGATNECVKLNNSPAVVTKVERKLSTLYPGKLFSTTSLQSAVNKLYEISPERCLSVCQKLYEEGFISYPRTDTEYIAESESGKIQKIIEILQKEGIPVEMKNSKSIFDSSKIVSHSAITPTYKIPQGLQDDEKKVYDTIMGRFIANFCSEKTTADKTIITINCADETFRIHGMILKTEGFLKYDKTASLKDKVVPDLKEGQAVAVKFHPKEAETKPAARYNVTTLNHYLENPFKKIKSEGQENEEDTEETEISDEVINDDKEYEQLLKGISIGTGATRAPIIQKAIDNQYISLKKKTYFIEPLGIYLIETMHELDIDISAHKTVEMTQTLKKVYNGELTIDNAVNLTMEDIRKMFQGKNKEIQPVKMKSAEKNFIGTCPACHGNVYENTYGYTCENNKKENGTCHFMFWKNDKFIKSITKKALSASTAARLLKDMECKITGQSKEKGKAYEMMLSFILDENQKVQWSTRFLTEDDYKEVGTCPLCGGTVKETGIGYVCENNKEDGDCSFILFKQDKFIQTVTKKTLSASVVKNLLADGECKVTGYSKTNNKPYPLFIQLTIENGKPKWETRLFTEDDREDLGVCPVCKKGHVYENRVGYACEYNQQGNGTCNFILWKKNKFIESITGKGLSASMVKGILDSGKCKITAHKKDDPSKKYSMYLYMIDYDGKYPKWETEFVKKKK